jgi:hypothetical protein
LGVDGFETPTTLNNPSSSTIYYPVLFETKTITIDRDGSVLVAFNMIGHLAGPGTLRLYVDGALKKQTATFTSADVANWENAVLTWAGDLSAGEHTISVSSDEANKWGAGPTWGSVNIMQFHSGAGQATTQCLTTNRDNPAYNHDEPAATKFALSEILMGQDGFAYVIVNLPRWAVGQTSLYLFIDDEIVGSAVAYTPIAAWKSAIITWSGALTAGTTALLLSPF